MNINSNLAVGKHNGAAAGHDEREKVGFWGWVSCCGNVFLIEPSSMLKLTGFLLKKRLAE